MLASMQARHVVGSTAHEAIHLADRREHDLGIRAAAYRCEPPGLFCDVLRQHDIAVETDELGLPEKERAHQRR